MRALQDQADETMRADPAVRATFTMTGNARFLSSNQGLLLAFLESPEGRPPIQGVAGRMMGQLGTIPGVFPFLRPFPVLEISTGATNQNQGQYAFSLSGVDPEQVYGVATKLMGKLQGYPGFLTLSSDFFDHTPNLDVEIRRDQAKTYGVSETRILALLRNAYAQNYSYLIKKPTDQYEVILEVADAARGKAEDLSLLYIRSDDGRNLVPMSALVSTKPSLGPQAVNHLNQFTSVTIFFNLKPGVAVGEATDFITKAADEVVPTTVRAGLQGEALTFRDTVKDLTVLMLLAVFVMYVILAILYESYVHPLTVLSTLPTALVGGLLALWIFGEQASLYAFVGMFMLMGIVKKNGIMIVDFARQRVDAGEPAEKAIHDASMDRFRPILMTTLAAVIGAVPIALGYGADGASRRPLGLVVVGSGSRRGSSTASPSSARGTTGPAPPRFPPPLRHRRGSTWGDRGRATSSARVPTGANDMTAKIPSLRSAAALAALGALLAGCAVGPDYRSPEVKMPAAWGERSQAGDPSAAVGGKPPLAKWWTTFRDPVLDSLVERALAANPDLRLARARVREARALRGVAAADQGPTVDASGSFTRTRGGGTTSAGEDGDLFRAGFDASWEVDVFGGVRREVEAADADLAASVEDRRDVQVSILAEVAGDYVELRGAQRSAAIARANLQAQKETLELTRTRLQAGLASDLDLARAEAQVRTTGSEVPTLEAAARRSIHALGVLVGKEPSALSAELSREAPVPQAPPDVPVGLPSDLLRRRPDMRRAERQLAAATARIGEATADLFPRFSLTGSFGLQGEDSGDLVGAGGRFWSVGPSVRWPVLDFGRIRSRIAAQGAREEQAAIAYEGTILRSLREVEDALVTFSREQARRQELSGAVESGKRAADLAGELYRQGRSDFLSVLQAQRDLFASEDSLVRSDRSVAVALVSLYKALGGGWEVDAPAAEAPPAGRPGARVVDLAVREAPAAPSGGR